MNTNYYIARSEKQIENINDKLIELRKNRDKISLEIQELQKIRDLLKFAKRNLNK